MFLCRTSRRLNELEKEVESLRVRLGELEGQSTICVYDRYYSIYESVPKMDLKQAITYIMQHLGIKFSRNNGTPAHFTVEKKE